MHTDCLFMSLQGLERPEWKQSCASELALSSSTVAAEACWGWFSLFPASYFWQLRDSEVKWLVEKGGPALAETSRSPWNKCLGC